MDARGSMEAQYLYSLDEVRWGCNVDGMDRMAGMSDALPGHESRKMVGWGQVSKCSGVGGTR